MINYNIVSLIFLMFGYCLFTIGIFLQNSISFQQKYFEKKYGFIMTKDECKKYLIFKKDKYIKDEQRIYNEFLMQELNRIENNKLD